MIDNFINVLQASFGSLTHMFCSHMRTNMKSVGGRLETQYVVLEGGDEHNIWTKSL